MPYIAPLGRPAILEAGQPLRRGTRGSDPFWVFWVRIFFQLLHLRNLGRDLPVGNVESRIFRIRGQQVMLDLDGCSLRSSNFSKLANCDLKNEEQLDIAICDIKLGRTETSALCVYRIGHRYA